MNPSSTTDWNTNRLYKLHTLNLWIFCVDIIAHYTILSEHNGPAFEGNDSPTSRSVGNVNSEQSGVETHGKKLRGSAEQLPDRLRLSVQKVYVEESISASNTLE